MGILSRIFNFVPASERSGLRLDENDCWIIHYKESEYAQFFRLLDVLVPVESRIYIEGTSIEHSIRQYYELKKLNTNTKVAIGTIWPRPIFYHIAFNKDNVAKLADFFNNYAEPEVLEHLVIYKDNEVLISGYDFLDKEVWISSLIGEEKISAFCTKLSAKYIRRKIGA